MRDTPVELNAEVLSERGPILRCRVAGNVVDIARDAIPTAAEDVVRAAIENLILEGECLQDAIAEKPDVDAVAMWIDRARASLTGAVGHGHRFVVDVQQAADGAAHPASDAGLSLARYLRVLVLVVLSVLRRAASEWHIYARV